MYGSKVVGDQVAEQVLGEAVKYLAQTGVTAATKRAGGGVKRAIERELVAEGYELVAMGAGKRVARPVYPGWGQHVRAPLLPSADARRSQGADP